MATWGLSLGQSNIECLSYSGTTSAFNIPLNLQINPRFLRFLWEQSETAWSFFICDDNDAPYLGQLIPYGQIIIPDSPPKLVGFFFSLLPLLLLENLTHDYKELWLSKNSGSYMSSLEKMKPVVQYFILNLKHPLSTLLSLFICSKEW